MSISTQTTLASGITTIDTLDIHSSLLQNVIASTNVIPANPNWGDRYFCEGVAPPGWTQNNFMTYYDTWRAAAPGPGQIFNIQTGANAGLRIVNTSGIAEVFSGSAVVTSSPLTGNGASLTPITLANGTNYDVLQYNGAAWQLTNAKYSNAAFVDANGSDVTGQINNPIRPFATISAAQTALSPAANPSIIYVRPGTYTVTTSLLDTNISFYFDDGASVSSSTVNIFNWSAVTVLTTSVGGSGQFTATGTAQVLSLSNTSSFSFSAKSVSSALGNTITIGGNNSNLLIYCDNIISSAALSMTVTGASTVSVFSQTMTGGISITGANATVDMYSSIYSGTGTAAVTINATGSLVSISGSSIANTSSGLALSINAGSVYIRCSKCSSIGTNAISVTGAQASLILTANSVESASTSAGYAGGNGIARITTNVMQGIRMTTSAVLYADIGTLNNPTGLGAIVTLASAAGALYANIGVLNSNSVACPIAGQAGFRYYIGGKVANGTAGIFNISGGTGYINISSLINTISGYVLTTSSTGTVNLTSDLMAGIDGIQQTAGTMFCRIFNVSCAGANGAYVITTSGTAYISGSQVISSNACLTANLSGLLHYNVSRSSSGSGACVILTKNATGTVVIANAYMNSLASANCITLSNAVTSTLITILQNCALVSTGAGTVINLGGAAPTVRIYGTVVANNTSATITFVVGTYTSNASVV